MGRRAFIKMKIEILRGFIEGSSSGVAKTLVPKVGGDGGGEAVMRRHKSVEITGRITSEKHRPCGQILNRKAMRVKFDGNRIITSKDAYRNKFFY